MQLLELGTNKVLIDLTDSPKLYDFTPRFFDPGRQSYRRGDKRLVTNDSNKDKAELRFEFQRLTQAEVDTLEAIYRSREPFICLPDSVDEPEKAYIVRWVSSFDRRDTVVTDWSQGRSLQAVFRTVDDPNIYTPAIRIEIEGVDVTDRLTRDAQGRWEPITIGQSLDHPRQSIFRNSLISFNLDNEDGAFDYSSPNNFFVPHSKPVHGRGAEVLIRLGLSKSALTPAFAGQINEIQTSLGNTKARVTIGDLSAKLSHNVVESFGEEITRRITDFDGANADYDDLDPIFYFPVGLRQIVRGSVRVTVHEEGGDVGINIVDVVGTSGVLSNRNAAIDYARGLIRFELPPADGTDTQITATWKVDYRHKRPDYLIRELLKQSGLQAEIGITDDMAARFGIEQALISHPTSEHFSSHGRPYPAENGVVRWMKRDDSGNTPVWGMIQDQRYLEYDEYQDTYTKIATLPEEGGLDGVVNVNYGMHLPGESFQSDLIDQNNIDYGIARDGDRLYMLDSQDLLIRPLLLDGTPVEADNVSLPALPSYNHYFSLGVINGMAFVGSHRSGGTNISRNNRVRVIDLSDGSVVRTFAIGVAGTRRSSEEINSIDVTNQRLYAIDRRRNVFVYTHEGVRQTADEPSFTVAGVNEIAVNNTTIYLRHAGSGNTVEYSAYTLSWVRDEDKDLEITAPSGFGTVSGVDATGTRFYVLVAGSRRIEVFQLGVAVNFGGYVPYQFDTADNDNLFFITANNTQGNAVSSSTLRRIKIYKYTKSTKTWTDLLNATIGQPQLSQAYKIAGEVIYLADNRKNFQVIRRNGKTLVFYRRVQATRSGIAAYNDTNSILSDVYTENHSGAEDFGLPYSMDFALDERSDGIYVYTFVVRYTFESDGDYNGGTLKVFRRRIEVGQTWGTQSEIYSETFTKSSDEEDYPVSVSDLILADDRSKFYFVLDWHGEGDRPGKAELCTIAKSGSGGRAVIKTYDNPLIGPRSPAQMNGRYFYLEGGWVRPAKSDPTDAAIPDDEQHYPNEGGTLIEVQSDDTLTEHGQVWRSATKQDSPNADEESIIYDGWGLHNAVISNMIPDDRGNLHFVAGYGSPYNVDENLPFSSNREPVPSLANFQWLQWGKDLSTKIASFPTGGARVWALIQNVAQIMNWEIGFGPDRRKVDAVQAAYTSITDWGANASLFFRPRTILPAKLRTAIGASGTPSTLALNDSGLPAEMAEFPDPPGGERYAVIVGREMFSYTGVTPDSRGRTLSGIQRAQNRSAMVGHSADSGVYFVDYFASGELGTTLVGIQTRSQDFINLRNDVNVGYGDTFDNTKSQPSIDANGQFTLDIPGSLLSRFDKAWAEVIGQVYCEQLCELKELLKFTLVFSPTLLPGQLLVLYQQDRIQLDFKLFKLLSVQHHIPRWQTSVTALEIV